jgi:hypothetical protein
MAKKNGGGNNYTPIKNSELLQGQPDKRTPKQIVQDDKRPEVKKDTENWQDQAKRTTPKTPVSFKDRIGEKIKDNHQPKTMNIQEPEKDK